MTPFVLLYVLQPRWHLKPSCNQRVWLLRLFTATFCLPLSLVVITGAAPLCPLCVGHGLGYFFGLSFSLCLTLHFFLSPPWPCSAAPAICAQANREQRDGRRAVAVGVQERGRGNVKGEREGQWRLKEDFMRGLLLKKMSKG